MGYTTYFCSSFTIDRDLDPETRALLRGLATTRRVEHDIAKVAEAEGLSVDEATARFGRYGEFYFFEDSRPYEPPPTAAYALQRWACGPPTQPDGGCQWVLSDRNVIEWDGYEKFYFYVPWLEYILQQVLTPRGYSVSGAAEFYGEDDDDFGVIDIEGDRAVVTPGVLLIPPGELKWASRAGPPFNPHPTCAQLRLVTDPCGQQQRIQLRHPVRYAMLLAAWTQSRAERLEEDPEDDVLVWARDELVPLRARLLRLPEHLLREIVAFARLPVPECRYAGCPMSLQGALQRRQAADERRKRQRR